MSYPLITRPAILWRSTSIWPRGGVPYSQITRHHPDGYRCDCSGYVCLCWGIAAPGLSTETLVSLGAMVEIPWSDLAPGDAIGRCGPGTGGNAGHIQLVVAVHAGGLVTVREQGGGGDGWSESTDYPPDDYRAYRYVGTIEDEDMTMHTVRSGADDFSIYLAPGYAAPSGRMAAFGLDGPQSETYARLPQFQLPPGVSVAACGKYDIDPQPWPAGAGADHRHNIYASVSSGVRPEIVT